MVKSNGKDKNQNIQVAVRCRYGTSFFNICQIRRPSHDSEIKCVFLGYEAEAKSDA